MNPKAHRIHLEAGGGNVGCTEQLYQTNVDFILVIDNKRYRFTTTDLGNLSILCINGIDETTRMAVSGYPGKELVISAPITEHDTYVNDRIRYLHTIEQIKKDGCKTCSYLTNVPSYYVCSITGESFELGSLTNEQRSEQCPF